MTPKCQRCKVRPAVWAVQNIAGEVSVTTLGSHYRGFPVVKVCDECIAHAGGKAGREDDNMTDRDLYDAYYARPHEHEDVRTRVVALENLADEIVSGVRSGDLTRDDDAIDYASAASSSAGRLWWEAHRTWDGYPSRPEE